jgi:hypothetical protein
MPDTSTAPEPVRLSYADGKVIVTPDDQDRFMLSARKAIEACKNAVRLEEEFANFKNNLILPLKAWCERHAAKVSACYLGTPNHRAIPAYVVGGTERYDFELTDELVTLADELESNGWCVHVSQVPRGGPESLAALFDVGSALQVYSRE